MSDKNFESLLETKKSDPSSVDTGSAPDTQLISQRAENSVLFSLSNLTAVGDSNPRGGAGFASGGGMSGQADKSGLIDLSTLAKLGAGGPISSDNDAGSDVFGGQGATGAPALFNVGTRRSNKGLMFGIGFLLLVVVGLGVFLTFLLLKKEEEAPPSAAVVEEEGTDEDLGVEGAEAAVKKVEGEGVVAVDGDKKDETQPEGDTPPVDGSTGPTKDPTADAANAALDDTAALKKDDEKKDIKDDRRADEKKDKKDPNTDKKVAKDKKKEDKVGDTLNSIRDGGKSSAPPLDRDKVGAVLKANALKAKNCGSGGDLTVAFQIKASGAVGGVKTAGGSLAGTDAEKCIHGIVKGMVFPENDGAGKVVKFPFKL